MPYAFLNASGDVLGLSTTDISLSTYQTNFDDTATERIVGAPDGLVTTYRAGRWGNPDWFSRKTSGDGTHIEDYTNIDVPPVHDLRTVPVDLKNVQLNSENRTVVVPTPAPAGSFTWYTSRGDVLDPLARGEGTMARLTFSAAGDDLVELQFAESVYVHDGEINWRSIDEFDGTDHFSVYVKFGQSDDLTPNPGAGNCNIDTPPFITPAPLNDGDYDIDLDTACPIPSNSGPWVVNEKIESITVHTDGEDLGRHGQRIVLMTGYTPPNLYLVRNVAMSSPRGIFEIDAYLVEWMGRHWKLGLEVIKTKVPATPVEINGVIMLFRWNATTNGGA